eukprot:1159667-Pelagomonas_calceolata.AAC.2
MARCTKQDHWDAPSNSNNHEQTWMPGHVRPSSSTLGYRGKSCAIRDHADMLNQQSSGGTTNSRALKQEAFLSADEQVEARKLCHLLMHRKSSGYSPTPTVLKQEALPSATSVAWGLKTCA